MSEPVTALHGAVSKDGIAVIEEAPLQGMITLRGDLSSATIQNAACQHFPGEMPGPGHARIDGENGVAWMSPDEALILCEYSAVPEVLAQIEEMLDGTHALAVNVSDARASFRVTGPSARDVLAKVCPVDLAHTKFTRGMFRRTRLAQVPAALWLRDTDSLQLICFRSQAQYVFDVLKVAAQEGSEVGIF